MCPREPTGSPLVGGSMGLRTVLDDLQADLPASSKIGSMSQGHPAKLTAMIVFVLGERSPADGLRRDVLARAVDIDANRTRRASR